MSLFFFFLSLLLPFLPVSSAAHPEAFRWRKFGETCSFRPSIETVCWTGTEAFKLFSCMLFSFMTECTSNVSFNLRYFYFKQLAKLLWTHLMIDVTAAVFPGYVSDPMSTMRFCSSFSSSGSFEDSN